ncbi:MAG: acyl-ACP--UDP-N-acetylglucosamine O-acyltransferase [Gammaproteobacteria bacterium]|nr:acyl-ACP--UDP-N-acetylglucosamine O-acyltransferase [Gammaproteobacteria bacterium]
MIHPQAIVDSGAKLGKNVEVGPFTIIGDGVEVGDDTWIGPHVVISGPTRIGRNNKIYQFCSIGEAPQHINYRGEPTELVIGDRNTVREYCTLNRGTVDGAGITRVGDDNFLMAYVHVAHDCLVANNTILVNCASLAGHVDVGDCAVLGGFTVIHQFCRVGAHSITALGTIAFKDIPPYVLAAGNGAQPYGINIRGLKRRQFSQASIEALRSAYKTIYKSGLKISEAISELEDKAVHQTEVKELVCFIKTSERGIIR